ncbi:(2Fe-2S)-binding protein [Mycobacterium sp. 21AC1]|uniref:(2Fe-2S)-binding protein n=1 Tax=[Mycobacterium] appelbergii TaxID=2939269 RepID=UPI002938F7C4|nr:(2Fe-2S)-binding protein [Mycobacterium sp. 21AC1]MDV3127464.1 (2Fe-2S)-binding protein [Mycobacterium sp. 21AC1]
MHNVAVPAGEPAPPPDGTTLLAKTAELGEYFALSTPDDGEWQELSLLFDDAAVVDFVDRTRNAIAASTRCAPGSIPVKLAASSFQLGISARLLSPVVGAATCFGTVPLLNRQSLTWQPTSKHFPRFAITDVHWVEAPTPSQAAALIAGSLLTGVLGPLNAKLRSLTSLSSQVAWGNVISAANGAVTVVSMSQPQHESAGRALVRALMEIEPLIGTGSFAHGRFVRRSCCLFYQAPRGGLCGDCVLAVSGRTH